MRAEYQRCTTPRPASTSATATVSGGEHHDELRSPSGMAVSMIARNSSGGSQADQRLDHDGDEEADDRQPVGPRERPRRAAATRRSIVRP